MEDHLMPYESLVLVMLIVIMIQLAYIVYLLTRVEKPTKKDLVKPPVKHVEEPEDTDYVEWVPKPMLDDQDERLAKFHNLWPHNR